MPRLPIQALTAIVIALPLPSACATELQMDRLKLPPGFEIRVYAEVPGASHAFDVFHSTRTANAVRAVDRFLAWIVDRHGPGRTPEPEAVGLAPELAPVPGPEH